MSMAATVCGTTQWIENRIEHDNAQVDPGKEILEVCRSLPQSMQPL